MALENTPKVQNVIVCSLCSCTNWPVLGLPPEWYKSFEYRDCLVREGRTVLKELGEDLQSNVTVTGVPRAVARRGRPTGRRGRDCPRSCCGPLGRMLGYADDAKRTADVNRAGHYHTGDIASRDANGYITYIGPTDDVFKVSDYRISPFERESVPIEHAAVAVGAVIPSFDPVRLAVPKAVVTLTAGHTPSAELARDLLAFCNDRLGPYKRIRKIEFAPPPKTISGKIRRAELRRRDSAPAEDGKD